MRFAFSPLPKKLLQAKLFREPYLRERGRQGKGKGLRPLHPLILPPPFSLKDLKGEVPKPLGEAVGVKIW